ncbi:MAG: hypothetical protein Q4D38_11635 [Planctomycetia bacterium]|nr:hypothetical protein [Planctomycetia bacterium]
MLFAEVNYTFPIVCSLLAVFFLVVGTCIHGVKNMAITVFLCVLTLVFALFPAILAYFTYAFLDAAFGVIDGTEKTLPSRTFFFSLWGLAFVIMCIGNWRLFPNKPL